jgi:N-acetylglucosamine kinase-like BadF-type ATPase
MTRESLVVLDVGKTNVRIEHRDGHHRPARYVEPSQGWLGGPQAGDRLLAQLGIMLDRLRDPGAVSAVGGGFAGYQSMPEAHDALSTVISARFPQARVRLASDLVTAHLGAFDGGPGAILVAGTGAAALAVASHGARYTADGLGPSFGDEGSAGWIGREGCLSVIRYLDGRGPDTILAQSLQETLGYGIRDVIGSVASAPSQPGILGRFAPAVLAGWRSGDAVAAGIVQRAVSHLAATALAVLRRLPEDDRRLVVVGGLANDAPFLASIRSSVAAREPAVEFRSPEGDGLDGAATLVGGDTWLDR